MQRGMPRTSDRIMPKEQKMFVRSGPEYEAWRGAVKTILREQAADWFMYTAAPWLLDLYRDNIFRHQYTMLRPVETLACTDSLFAVAFEGGAWLARETLDAAARSRGYWEICTLTDICGEVYA